MCSFYTKISDYEHKSTGWTKVGFDQDRKYTYAGFTPRTGLDSENNNRLMMLATRTSFSIFIFHMAMHKALSGHLYVETGICVT